MIVRDCTSNHKAFNIIIIIDERREEEIAHPARPTREAWSFLFDGSLTNPWKICRTDIAEPQGPLVHALAFPGSVL